MSAIDWRRVRTLEADEYLVRWPESGLSDEEDSGSRGGFDDRELAEIETSLRERGLRLEADDKGLRVSFR